MLESVTNLFEIVMPALVAGIHALASSKEKDVDGRNRFGHNARVAGSKLIML